MSTDFRALCVELLAWADKTSAHYYAPPEVLVRARAALAEPESPAETLAVRPMMEQIAAMGDCIDQRTVGQIMAISQRAAAWLAENQPGQPVAVEPRGCPTPGACSCVIASACAALSEPEPEGPTDNELLHTATVALSVGDIEHSEIKAETELYLYGNEVVEVARAVLARWGRSDGPAVPDDREPASVAFEASDAGPADGEVAELATAEMMRQLRTKAATEKANRCHYSSKLLTRAADLLERLSPQQPVPVSERLPGHIKQALINAECALADIAEGEAEESDGDPLEWPEKRAAAALARIRPVMRQHQIQTSEWPPLPAHALPVPGEVEHG